MRPRDHPHFHRSTADAIADPKSQSISHRLGAARKKAAGIFDGGAAKVVPATTVPLTPRGGGCSSIGRRSTGKAKKVKDELTSDDESIAFNSPSVKRESVRTAGRKRSYQEPETDDEEDDDDADDEFAALAKKVREEAEQDGRVEHKRVKMDGDGRENGEAEPPVKSASGGGEELSETDVDTVADPEEV